jgi:hypothetical protein
MTRFAALTAVLAVCGAATSASADIIVSISPDTPITIDQGDSVAFEVKLTVSADPSNSDARFQSFSELAFIVHPTGEERILPAPGGAGQTISNVGFTFTFSSAGTFDVTFQEIVFYSEVNAAGLRQQHEVPILEQFPLVHVNAVPGPIVGAGLPGLIFAGGGLLGWCRRKRKADAAA